MNNSSSWEVSFYDLFLYILQRWRMLLIFLIAGAIVVGGIGVIRSSGSKETAAVTLDQTRDKWSAVLNDDQKQYVEIIADQIRYRENMVQGVKDYVENSYYMTLDPFNMYTCDINFSVAVEHEGEIEPSELAALVTSYVSALKDAQTRQRIDEVLGTNADSYSVDSILGLNHGSVLNIIPDDKDLGLFTVTVYAASQEDLDLIVQEIQNIVSDRKESVTHSQGEHAVILLGIDQSTEYNEYIRANQINIVQMVKTLNDQNKEMKAAVAGAEEKQYLEYLLKPEEVRIEEENTIGTPETADVETKAPVSLASRIRSNLKKAVIGALLGLVIAVILLIIRYISQGRIRRAADLEKYVNSRVIARFDGDTSFIRTHKTALDRWLRKKRNRGHAAQTYEETVASAASSINLIASRNNMKKIALAASGVEAGKIAEDISNASGAQTEITAISNILSSADGISRLEGIDGIILAAGTDVTLRNDISDLIGVCNQCGLPVAGSIVLE